MTESTSDGLSSGESAANIPRLRDDQNLYDQPPFDTVLRELAIATAANYGQPDTAIAPIETDLRTLVTKFATEVSKGQGETGIRNGIASFFIKGVIPQLDIKRQSFYLPLGEDACRELMFATFQQLSPYKNWVEYIGSQRDKIFYNENGDPIPPKLDRQSQPVQKFVAARTYSSWADDLNSRQQRMRQRRTDFSQIVADVFPQLKPGVHGGTAMKVYGASATTGNLERRKKIIP